MPYGGVRRAARCFRICAYVGVGESLVKGGRVEEQPLQHDGTLSGVFRVQRVSFAVLFHQVGDDGAAEKSRKERRVSCVGSER